MKSYLRTDCVMIASLLLAVSTLHAQNYAIDWFKISGGGSSSTGGIYSLGGTIGQSDAVGTMSGGGFALEGGFWSITVAGQTSGAPTLLLSRSGANVILSWDAGATGFVLEQTGSLSAPIQWQPVSGVSSNSVTDPASPGWKFYRLRHP